MKQTRSVAVLGCMIFLAFAVTFIVAACNSSSSGGSSGDKMELSEQTISETLSIVEDSVPGCRIVGATGSMAAAPVDMVKATVSKNMALASIKNLAGFQLDDIPGDCGGSLKIDSSHQSGNTTDTFTFDNFCFYEDNEGVQEEVLINGKFISTEEGTPGDSGPTIHGVKARTDGKITVKMPGETISLALDDLNISYGVPGVWGPDEPTQSNPDRMTIKQASIDMPSRGISHSLKNVKAESFVSGSNDVLIVEDGRYSNGKKYVDIYTSQPLVMDTEGDIVDGKLAMEGAGGDILEISAGTGSGVMQIEKNGVRISQDLDCSGMDIPVMAFFF